MNIFLESNSLQEIREAAAAGLVQGVSFSPNEFAYDDPDGNQRERLEELSHEFAIPICVTIGACSLGRITSTSSKEAATKVSAAVKLGQNHARREVGSSEFSNRAKALSGAATSGHCA